MNLVQKEIVESHMKTLDDYFDKENVHYSIDLYKTIDEIFPDELEEIKYMESWFEEGRGVAEILEYTNEFCDRIWYNRHLNLRYEVENGIRKIIEEYDSETYNSSQEIVRDIWEGALKSAAKMEALYGDKLEPMNDFEWGMLNGKLSALRWVLGDEWDMLDT